MELIKRDYKKVLKIILPFIKKYTGKNYLCLGLSGGIDSTLCAVLASKAIGRKKVIGIISPSRYTPEADINDIKRLAPKLCGRLISVSKEKLEKIREAYDSALPGSGEQERIIMDAYIRNSLLRRFSRLNKVRLLGTINGTEWRLGYYPKYVLIGDMLPIADLYKTQIFELAEYLNVPKEIIEKKPTLGLGCSPNAKEEKKSPIDEHLIRSGLRYPELDLIISGIENKLDIKEILKMAEKENKSINSDQIKTVKMIMNIYRHKRKLPPYPKINPGKLDHNAEEYEEH